MYHSFEINRNQNNAEWMSNQIAPIYTFNTLTLLLELQKISIVFLLVLHHKIKNLLVVIMFNAQQHNMDHRIVIIYFYNIS